jgi:phosphate:Na+ symporter
MLFNSITGDPALCILIAAALTWLAHSSVATVLLIMSLAFSHFVTPEAALALVVGANVGSAINPVIEGSRRDDPTSYRVPMGNLINRLVGVIITIPFLHPIAAGMSAYQPDAAKMVAEFHIGFNVVLALAFIGLLDPLSWLLIRAFPERKKTADAATPRYLEESDLASPALALADAARETLHAGDIVEDMLQKVMSALMTNDRALVAEVTRMDNAVDRLTEAIKLYLTKLTSTSLDEREGRRAMEIISFSINLEHIGDIIDKNLDELAAKKVRRKLQFSNDGAAEITAFHKTIVESLRMAFGVFMSGDIGEARKLLAKKAQLRAAEIAAAERHFERLREGRPETIETTSLHLDVLRDLRRIHSHICTVAYPVLEACGEVPAVREGDPLTLDVQSARPTAP